MSQSVEPTGRSSPGGAATSYETVTEQTGPLGVPGMTPVGSASVKARPPTSAGGQAPALSFASTAMPAPVTDPRLPWSLDTPGGDGGQGFGYTLSLSYATLHPSRSPSGHGSGPLFENQSGGPLASGRAWGSRGPGGESGDLLVQALGDLSQSPVTKGARSLRPWLRRGQPSG